MNILSDALKTVVNEASYVNFKHPAKKSPLKAAMSEPILICVVKNELIVLQDFYDHYRKLGVKLFVIIDNGSTDGSDEFCKNQPDTDLHYVHRPFVWPQKQGWITRAIVDYGLDRWYLYVDADERLVFDGCEQRSLQELINFAERVKISRIRGMLIDMYQDGPVLKFDWPKRQNLISAFPLYDSDSYNEAKFKQLISRKGGPRKRALNGGDDKFNPELTKYPLFKPSLGDIFGNPHHLYPYEQNFVSDCYVGILHYKFIPGFMDKIQKALKSGSYWNESYEYSIYLKSLSKDESLQLSYSGSLSYKNSSDLITSELVSPINWFC